jgi:acetyl esterase/lipase
MPSRRHQLLVHVIPRLRRSGEVVDPERERLKVVARQSRARQAAPERGLRGCTVMRVEGCPFAVYDVRRTGSEPTHTVLYLHGGGYVSGIDRFHWRYVARLARGVGVRVVVPAYPLAPGHTWRDAHPPLHDLFDQLAIESPGGVTLMGDSAGGGLALEVAQQIAASAGPQPTGLVLLSPWVDLTGSTPGTDEAAAWDPWLSLSKMHLYGSWWAGVDDVARPELSPLFGDLSGLPPALVFCGTRDLLQPQVRALADQAPEAGWQVEYDEQPGLLHVFPILPIPEAGPAFERVKGFLARREA